MMKTLQFEIDDESLSIMDRMMARGNHESKAELVRHALELLKAVQKGSDQGYTEVILRHPRSHDKLIITRNVV